MAKWYSLLNKWRADRNITSPSNKFIQMVDEEIDEHHNAISMDEQDEFIDSLADICILTYNQACLESVKLDLSKSLEGTIDDIETILHNQYIFGEDNTDTLQAIYSITYYILITNGYIPELVYKKASYHILERPQLPEQFHRWKANPELAQQEKWQKDPTFEQQLPDYSTCRGKSR